MDKEFLALSVAFMIMGFTGIVVFSSLFYNGSIFPVPECGGTVCTPSSVASADACFCLISSPEPSAAQGTSSILLAMGVLFFPMGLMKGGLPSFRKGFPASQAPIQLPSGRVVTPLQIASSGYFIFGIIVLLVGADAVLAPGYIVYKNPYMELAGAMLTAAGAISIIWGLRKPRA